MRRTVLSVAVLASLISVALLVLLLVVDGLQKKHLSDLSSDIAKESQQLEQKPQIDKILTVQNQLQSLTALHDSKPAVSRLFTYLNQVTPANVNITNLAVDYTANTMTITGTSNALSSVNKYIDTLKFTTYSNGANTSKAFSNVVLSTFGVSASSGNQTTYSLTLGYDPAIFNITQDIALSVPSQVTTRAVLEQPQDLFQAAPATSGGGN
jgi:uncharacterized membrane protein